MPSFSIPGGGAGGSKTRFFFSLTSGTSWTVPAGVTRVNVLLIGGGGGGGGINVSASGGAGGSTTFAGATTASGGNGGSGQFNSNNNPSWSGASQPANTGLGGYAGGWTNNSSFWFTTGTGANGAVVASTVATTPGASIAYSIGAGGTGGNAGGGAGGSGRIDIEYYV